MSAAKRPVVPIADMKLLLPPEDTPAEFPPEPDPEPPPLAMFCWADWNAALRAETPPQRLINQQPEQSLPSPQPVS
ncbi:hypothetical protein, partial [Xylella fastidiosa]|uniref:hypothetical protein n=1 Tax=Xylella fastidiosa TaxID=2371 RepID=UPI0018EF6CF4